MKINGIRPISASALTACILIAASVRPVFSDTPTSPQLPQPVTVPTALSGATAFSANWTYTVVPAKEDAAPVEALQGHTLVRRNSAGVSYRNEIHVFADLAGVPLSKPEAVTTVYDSGKGVAYNTTRDMYIRATYKNTPYGPESMTPWEDRAYAVGVCLGRLLPGTTPATADEVLNGIPVRVYIWRQLNSTFDGKHSLQAELRYFYAKNSNLPLRESFFLAKDGGKLRESWHMDVTDCKPLSDPPADQFTLAIAKTAKEYVSPLPPLLAPGTTAPDFAAVGEDRRPIKLSDLKGKIVILDFWATWCDNCQAAMPHLQHVYEQVKDKNVTVLAVCVLDKNGAYDKWLSEHRKVYTFPTAFDPAEMDTAKSVAGRLYHSPGPPTQIIVDKDGQIAAVIQGFDGPGDHRLEAALAKLGMSVRAETETAAR